MLKLVFLYWYNSVGKRFSVISYSFQGILVAKKKLFKNKIPDNCGGGTVFYVGDFFVTLCIHVQSSSDTQQITCNIFKNSNFF